VGPGLRWIIGLPRQGERGKENGSEWKIYSIDGSSALL